LRLKDGVGDGDGVAEVGAAEGDAVEGLGAASGAATGSVPLPHPESISAAASDAVPRLERFTQFLFGDSKHECRADRHARVAEGVSP
jgi:hypothetical protein